MPMNWSADHQPCFFCFGFCFVLFFFVWFFGVFCLFVCFVVFAVCFLSYTVTAQWIMYRSNSVLFRMHIVYRTDVATDLIRWICKMQLSFRLDKRPGESHLALDGKNVVMLLQVRFQSTRHVKRTLTHETLMFESWPRKKHGAVILRDEAHFGLSTTRQQEWLWSGIFQRYLITFSSCNWMPDWISGNQARHWYGRVPSKSNPADNASRLEFGSCSNSTRSKPLYQFALESVKSFWQLMERVEMGRKGSHQ